MPRSANTRERMMDAAERMFHRHGFGGVSVEEVTTAVGVKKPDLYNHFRDKNELYTAVRLRRLDRLEADLGRVLAQVTAQDLAPEDALTAVVAVLLRHPYFLSAPIQRDAETFLPDAARDRLFARAYGAVYGPLAAFIRGGPYPVAEDGIALAVEALLGLCAHFAALGAAEAQGPEERLRMAERVAGLWRHGVEGCADA